MRPGDNLFNIAKARLGNPNLYPLIEAANQDKVGPNGLIFPGEVLTIPSVATPPPHSVAQIVQPGDTVWGLAGGNPALVQQIIKVNKLTDPSLILPGQALIIPPAP